MSLADNEFHDLLATGALVERSRIDALDQRQRHLDGAIEGVPVVAKLYENRMMVRAEIGAPFPEALGVDLEMVTTGERPLAVGVRDDAAFDRLFHVMGTRDGVPLRQGLSPSLKSAAMDFVERFGGDLAIKEGGVLWAKTFSGEAIDLAGQGSALVRAAASLAVGFWQEVRTADPSKQGRPPPTLTGAPASPKALILGGVASIVATLICTIGAVAAFFGNRDIWIFLAAVAFICLPIGVFLTGFGLWRLRKVLASH